MKLTDESRRTSTVQELFAAKRKARSDAINRLVADACTRGECSDRLYWTLIYDFEHAPITTNLRQLEEAGVCAPTPDLLSDSEVVDALWAIITGLGELGIYLLHTNHLPDRALYERLRLHILVEPVRDLAPDSGVHEFIDLIGGGGTQEREIYQRHYATANERTQFLEEFGFEIAVENAPSERDRTLPRPPVRDDLSKSADRSTETKN